MILAIDCGSTNHKVALFDGELRRLADGSRPLPYAVRQAGRVEFAPERFWQDTLGLIRQVCAAARVHPRQIRTVTLASQAQTFTLLNEAGEPVLPFLSWADKRARAEAAELQARLSGDFHRHCSFPSPLPQLQLCKLLWAARHLSPWPGPLKVLSLPAFLAWKLASLHLTDPNLAAMTGLYSLALKQWWPEALALCGLASEHCGQTVELGTAMSARRPCADLELSPEVQVVLAGNDQTAGAYANGLRSTGLVVTLGTALVVYRFAGETGGPFSPAGCWGPYPGGGFYELVTRDEGGLALDWAVAQLLPGNEAGFFEAAAKARPGSARFWPERMHAAAAWSGPADMAARARAVLEGLCFSVRELVQSLGPGRTDDHPVTVIGGGSASAFWLQMLANVLARPLVRGRGDILLGAAMLARPHLAPLLAGNPDRIFTPQAGAVEQYEHLFRSWQQHRISPLSREAS
jgi:xylulokinase